MQFHSLHIGGNLKLWDRCCLQSFADFGHEIIVFGYERFDVPPGVQWAPAQDILSEKARDSYFAERPVLLQRFSNYFRYVLLHKQPAFWVDTDVLCLSGSVPDDDIVLGREDSNSICGAIMRLPPGHGLLAEAIEISRTKPDSGEWGDIGPKLLTRLAADHGLAGRLFEPAALYPFHWSAVYDLVDPESCTTVENLAANRAFLHLWQTIFRWGGFQTDFMPPARSFLAKAFARHGGDGIAMLDAEAVARQIRIVRERNAWMREANRLKAELESLRR